ncbi:MAG: carboxylating nicotinate-nucleotide diphosphorylase [Verrucomicrobia bacterium]|nr:carboxylating nicotinate-nucleotide diphosphorylase [Verrucomicrobiota bacterium]
MQPATDLIDLALAEDVGPGDLTSLYFIPADLRSKARIFAKEPVVVAGTEVVRSVFGRISAALSVQVARADGETADTGDTVLELEGPTRAILTGERLALNFLQRLSGVATLTRAFVRAVEGTGAAILDTRKTTPGMRLLEKAAVKAGGGKNHRMGLYDGVMVKDNHLLAKPDLASVLKELRKQHPGLLLELEADTVEQVREFVTWPEVDVILLDNMTLEEMRACVTLRRPGLRFEASGGLSLGTVRAVAETGVDYVSVGQLTHSARAVDLSLELIAP